MYKEIISVKLIIEIILYSELNMMCDLMFLLARLY